MKQVKVTWVDSKFYSHEWLTAEEASSIDVGQCETMGYLVFEDQHKVIIAQSLNLDCGTVHNLMIIPKKSIKKIKKL